MKKPLAFLALPAAAFAAGALAACSSNSLTSVDLTPENHPPLAVTMSGTQITIPEGIGVAFVVTLHINNKTSDDTATVSIEGEICDVTPGIDKNEFFLACNDAGTATLLVTDGPDDGEVRVPITVTLQPGSVSFPDGGFPMPPAPDGGTPDAPSATDAPAVQPDATTDGAGGD